MASGALARKFGMAIDNLESVDIVTADGKLRHTSASENPELFWGVRGGGGNFGVVTNFEFRLHPMQREVVAGTVTFPIARARDVLGMFSEYAADRTGRAVHGPSHDLAAGRRSGFHLAGSLLLRAAEGRGTRARAHSQAGHAGSVTRIKTVDYVEVQRWNDSGDSRAIASYLKGGFITQLPDKLVSALVDGFQGDPGRITLLFFQHCGGAGSRQAEGATAFAQRDALANMMTVAGGAMGAADPDANTSRRRARYWSTLEPFTRGFYVNDLAREVTAKDINSNYRGNYQRLVALKKKYDPTNLFRLNANVQPKA